jgi:uncharacterized protein involved in exopolysaccharide biosynthesis
VSAVAPGHKPADLMGYMRLFWGRWPFISVLTFTAGAAAAAFAFLVPPTYEAVTTVISAGSSDRLGGLASLGANLEDLGLGGLPKANSPAMYPDIVRSRRLLEQVLRMPALPSNTTPTPKVIDLVQPSGDGDRRMELAVRKLRRSVTATLDRRSGVLTIRVRARQPQLAAAMANTLDSLLQDFMVHSFTSQAAENRKFIEGRLDATHADLARAEDELKAFRERNLRIGNSPRLQLEEGRLARNLREQEEVYLTLRRQYEVAKVEERRDTPVINIIDVATKPTLRLSPRRGRLIIMGLLIGASVGCVWVATRWSGKSTRL